MKIVLQDTRWYTLLRFRDLEPGDVFRDAGDFYVRTRINGNNNAMCLTGEKPFDFSCFNDEDFVEWFRDAHIEIGSTNTFDEYCGE